MEDETKVIKQKQGAMQLKLKGENHLVLSWKDNMIEIYHNGKRKFIIDMNDD